MPHYHKPSRLAAGRRCVTCCSASGAVVMLAPFVLMVSLSFKPPAEIFAAELALAATDLACRRELFGRFHQAAPARYILNGFFVTGAIFSAPNADRRAVRLRAGQAALARSRDRCSRLVLARAA